MATLAIQYGLARLADARRIASLSRDHIEYDLPWSWTPARVAQHIQHRDSVVLIAHNRLGLAGFAIMVFADTTAHLSLLCVTPEHQRAGVGRELMLWLEESARVAGTFDIALEVRAGNRGARRFYHQLGYREVGRARGYYQGIETAVRMKRDLRV